MLLGHYIAPRSPSRMHALRAGEPAVGAINTAAAAIDRRSAQLREPVPGSLIDELPRRGGSKHERRSSRAAAGSSARTSCARCSSAATRCACSTTSRPAAARTSTGLDVEVVEGELRSYERVHNAVRGAEVVFHLGALGSVPRSVQDPLTSSAVNVEGTLNVLLAARDEGVRRVVFSSSSSVYGSSGDLPRTETMPPDPISPYGVAKLAAERYCVSFCRVYESLRDGRRSATSTSSARGRARSRSTRPSMPLFITAIAAGEPVTIYGDGEQSRDFTYVEQRRRRDDRAPRTPTGASGRIFNVAAGAPASVNQVADTIGEILGKPVEKRVRAAAAPATSATRGPTSPRPARCSATSRRSALEEGLRRTAEALLVLTTDEPIRVLRVIARLNMGGPALHVAYLTQGLEERGYETTLVAGSLARGESSMSFVAEELGVEVIRCRSSHREISPLYDTIVGARGSCG